MIVLFAFILSFSLTECYSVDICPERGEELYLWSVQRTNESRPSWLFGTIHHPHNKINIRRQVKIAFKYSEEIFIERVEADPECYIYDKDFELPEEIESAARFELRQIDYELRKVDLYIKDEEWLLKWHPHQLAEWMMRWSGKLTRENFQHSILDHFLVEEAEKHGKGLGSGESAEERCYLDQQLKFNVSLRYLNNTLEYLSLLREYVYDAAEDTEESPDSYNCLTLEQEEDYLSYYPFNKESDLDKEFVKWDKEEMLIRRNQNMANRIESLMLASNTTRMYAYGMAHFFEPESVVSILLKKGFIVKRIGVEDNMEWINPGDNMEWLDQNYLNSSSYAKFPSFSIVVFIFLLIFC